MRAASAMGDAPGDTFKIINGIEYRKGDKVRLKLGQRRADAADLLMDKRIATIEIIYTDYEDNIHIAVTIDDDPGQEMRREFGLYLFFSPQEVEHL